ncbi:MAG: diguanylate cyclase [Rhodoferax sp.]|nr:diguanylate cyclase [Rhodoferax sp.]
MAAPGYILLVEHQADHAAVLQSLLQAQDGASDGFPFIGVRVTQTLEAALQLLDAEPDCAAVLLDLKLPDTESLSAIRAHAPDVPVLVLVDAGGAGSGLRAVLAGAQDYLVRHRLDGALLMRALQYAGQRLKVEAALIERALHDTSTGLPRRRLLLDRLGVAMKRCTRDGSSGALLLIELNGLKSIPGALNHLAYDAVLRIAGTRLSGVVRSSDTVAWLGAHEFAVLLPKESGLLEALAIGEKLLASLREPMPAAHTGMELSASIGVVRFRDATESPDSLLTRAHDAMPNVGKDGKGRVRLL